MALSASRVQDFVLRSRALLFILGCLFGMFIFSMLREAAHQHKKPHSNKMSKHLSKLHGNKGFKETFNPPKKERRETHQLHSKVSSLDSRNDHAPVAITGISTAPGLKQKKTDKNKHVSVGKNPSESELPWAEQSKSDKYDKALMKYSSPTREIVLSSVDFAYISLAKNLYYTSLKKFKIINYLFVASDPRVCPALSEEDINCVDFLHVKGGDKAEPFYKNIFKLKSFMKTKVVLKALQLNLTVLLVDVDMVFLKNPLKHFSCPDCDMECMSEWRKHGVINTGFYLAKPTPATISLHERSNRMMDNDTSINHLRGSDQLYINEVLASMHKAGTLKYKLLNESIFPNAMIFFEDGERFFRGEHPCKQCVVVHNNFIISLDAKIYRFKEYGMWDVDENHYYSDRSKKYLIFDNPINITDSTTTAEVITRETNALKTALKVGNLLNRIVILPKFHNIIQQCKQKKCTKKWKAVSLQGLYYIEHFNKYFGTKYREHTFLEHAKVPKSIKKSLSPIYMFESAMTKDLVKDIPKNVNVMKLMDKGRGVTKDELLSFAEQTNSHAVLRFHNMYFSTAVHTIDRDLKNALTRSSYTQHFKGATFLKKYNLTV